jgi:hypothetical protein
VQQAHQHAHRRRLARAIGSEKAEDLTLLNVEGHIDNTSALAVALRKPIGLNNSRHTFLLFASLHWLEIASLLHYCGILPLWVYHIFM